MKILTGLAFVAMLAAASWADLCRIDLVALDRNAKVEIQRYLAECGEAFGIADTTQVGRVVVDRPWPGMRTIVISQQFGGMLTGKGLVLDVDEENGNVLRSYHGFAPIPSGTTTTPSLSKETAVEIAKMAFDRADAQVMAASVGFYSKPQWETIYLAWSVTLKSSRPTFSGITFHIDAHTGRVLDEQESFHTNVFSPKNFQLRAMPNPFNSQTTIRFFMPMKADAVLSVHSVDGAQILLLERGNLAAGEHVVAWDSRDDAGRNVGSGVYIVRLSTMWINTSLRMVNAR